MTEKEMEAAWLVGIGVFLLLLGVIYMFRRQLLSWGQELEKPRRGVPYSFQPMPRKRSPNRIPDSEPAPAREGFADMGAIARLIPLGTTPTSTQIDPKSYANDATSAGMLYNFVRSIPNARDFIRVPFYSRYALKAQILRIRPSADSNIGDGYMNFSQIQIINSIGRNIALLADIKEYDGTRLVTTTSNMSYLRLTDGSQQEPGNAPSNAWVSSSSNRSNSYLELNFGSPQHIQAVTLFNRKDARQDRMNDLRFEWYLPNKDSNAGPLLQMAESPSTGLLAETFSYTMNGTPARYLAIFPPSASTPLKFKQIQVFSTDGTNLSTLATTRTYSGGFTFSSENKAFTSNAPLVTGTTANGVNNNFTDANYYQGTGYYMIDFGDIYDVGNILYWSAKTGDTVTSVGTRFHLFGPGTTSNTSNLTNVYASGLTISNDMPIHTLLFLNPTIRLPYNDTKSMFDPFYDEFERQQYEEQTAAQSVSKTEAQIPTWGYEVGELEGDITQIPWDADNTSVVPKDVLWGFVSQPCSESLYEKAYQTALIRRGAYDMSGAKVPIYKSPIFKLTAYDPETKAKLEALDTLGGGGIGLVGGTVAGQLGEYIEKSIHKAVRPLAEAAERKIISAYSRAGKTVAENGSKPIRNAARDALAKKTKVAVEKTLERSALKRAELKVAQKINNQAVQATEEAMNRSKTLPFPWNYIARIGAAAALLGEKAVRAELYLASRILDKMDLYLAALSPIITTIMDMYMDTNGSCPDGYTTIRGALGGEVGYQLFTNMVPGFGSLFDLMDRYVCYKIGATLFSFKPMIEFRLPEYIFDPSCSLYHHNFDASPLKPRPKSDNPITGVSDPGYTLPERRQDLTSPVGKPEGCTVIYCEFADPIMIERMIAFYNRNARANPYIIEDGRIEYKIIMNIRGVMASSELSCDVRCVMKTIRHDPITGDNYEEVIGCTYPNDPASCTGSDAANTCWKDTTDCFRRFYFYRSIEDQNNTSNPYLLTVTGCTHEDYTAPDAMVHSWDTRSNVRYVQSLPKQYRYQINRRYKPFNLSGLVEGLLTSTLPAAAALKVGGKVSKKYGARLEKRFGETLGDAFTGIASGIAGGIPALGLTLAGQYATDSNFTNYKGAMDNMEDRLNNMFSFVCGRQVRPFGDPNEVGDVNTITGVQVNETALKSLVNIPDVSPSFVTDQVADVKNLMEFKAEDLAGPFSPNFWTYNPSSPLESLYQRPSYQSLSNSFSIQMYDPNLEQVISGNKFSGAFLDSLSGLWSVVTSNRDVTIYQGPAVEFAEGITGAFNICSNMQTYDGLCVDKSIVKQVVSTYNTKFTSNQFVMKAIDGIEPRGRDGCYYRYYDAAIDANGNESSNWTQKEIVMKFIQPDPNTCIFVPDSFTTDLTQYPIRELTIPDIYMSNGVPTLRVSKTLYPTRCNDSNAAYMASNGTARPFRYPKKPFRVPPTLNEYITLGDSNCPTRKCQDMEQVQNLVRGFNAAHSNMRILNVLRGFTPTTSSCDYEVEMERITSTGSSNISVRVVDGVERKPGSNYPAGTIFQSNATVTVPIQSSTLSRETLRIQVQPGSNGQCLFDYASDSTALGINGGKSILNFDKNYYGYDIDGGMQNFNQSAYQILGMPDTTGSNSSNNPLRTNLISNILRKASDAVQTISYYLGQTNTVQEIKGPVSRVSSNLDRVKALTYQTSGITTGCPTTNCASPAVLSSIMNTYNILKNTYRTSLGVEMDRMTSIRRVANVPSTASGPAKCHITYETVRRQYSSQINPPAYDYKYVKSAEVTLTNTGGCTFIPIRPNPFTAIDNSVTTLAVPEANLDTPFVGCPVSLMDPTFLRALKTDLDKTRSAATGTTTVFTTALAALHLGPNDNGEQRAEYQLYKNVTQGGKTTNNLVSYVRVRFTVDGLPGACRMTYIASTELAPTSPVTPADYDCVLIRLGAANAVNPEIQRGSFAM